ncbi:doublecortin domain-containing protein 2 isoform X3 [Eleginops maclovinus]|uniref:doublecortin domain-containing protein 2 isoform X3 n=1 Tax=Eleginops maclovinus TaxID=56733 RepID=UPI0030807DCA
MPGTAVRGDLPPTKTIIVYKNGDAFFPGRRLVVNPRQLSTFDSFLTFLTRGLEASDAVRKLYTPIEGHKVQHLDDLKHGSVYVAAGKEQFKKLDYSAITTKKPQNKKREQIRPVVHSSLVVSARWKKATDESCTINVFTNGEVLVAAVRIRIPKYTLRSWEHVLTMVTEKVRLRTGAVHRLCTLGGRPVCGLTELENNQYYVAVGAEKFKALQYDHCNPWRDVIKDNNRIEGQNTLPAVGKTRHPKVEAKIVDEEYEEGSCSASPCKASLHDSHSFCLQRSLSAASRKDVSTLFSRLSSRKGETSTGSSTGAGDTGFKTPENLDLRLCGPS